MGSGSGTRGDERPCAFFQQWLAVAFEHVRQQTALDRVEDDGHTLREHLLASAKRGSEYAQGVLNELVECPQLMEDYVLWAYQLHGRSGVGMAGVAPLSYTNVEAWMRLMDISLEPYEIDALMVLDAAMIAGRSKRGTDEEEESQEQKVTAWPDRKE